MPRPVWSEVASKGTDISTVADYLEAAAQAAVAPLQFEPVALPAGIDMGLLHQAALLRARRLLSVSHGELDRILAQEVRAIDDLVRTANLLVERLREWYSLHAPEATRLITGSAELAKLVSEQGDREAVMKALDHAKSAETSLGTDLEPGDLAVLRGFAAALAAVHASWTALEARVAELMEKVAPNVGSVVGPVIGARLIALSGGLERLASWPASTVQLLGAETALFRHIKEGTKPPKHGILFQHPSVHQAAPWSRGAVARALALAASTGAKADAFTKNDLRVHLAAQLKADMERIAKRKMPARPQGQFGRGPPRGPPRSNFGGPSRGPSYGAPRGPARDAPQRGPWTPGPPSGPRQDDRGGFGERGPGGGGSGDRGPPRQPWVNAPRDAPSRDAPSRDVPPRSGSDPRPGWTPRSPARDARDAPRDGPRFPGEGRGGTGAGGGAPGRGAGGASWGGGGAGGGQWGRNDRRDDRGDDRRGSRDGGRSGGGGGAGSGGWGGGSGASGGLGGSGGYGAAGAGKPYRRKPQGAFRSDNKPAAPPGRGKEDDQ